MSGWWESDQEKSENRSEAWLNTDFILDLISQGFMNQKMSAIAAALMEPPIKSLLYHAL